MPPGGTDRPLYFLRVIAAASLTLLIIALLGLLFAPRDPGTLTLYGLVIGLNLLVAISYWPVVRYLRHLERKEKEPNP